MRLTKSWPRRSISMTSMSTRPTNQRYRIKARNRHRKTRGRRKQRTADASGQQLRAAHRRAASNRFERFHHAPDRAEQAHQRANGRHAVDHAQKASQVRWQPARLRPTRPAPLRQPVFPISARLPQRHWPCDCRSPCNDRVPRHRSRAPSPICSKNLSVNNRGNTRLAAQAQVRSKTTSSNTNEQTTIGSSSGPPAHSICQRLFDCVVTVSCTSIPWCWP